MSAASHTLPLSGELTIYRAAELKDQLAVALSKMNGGSVDIDLSSVTEIDCTGVQLLMSAKRTARAAGISLALTSHSSPVMEVIELLDLAAFFGDSLVVPA